MLLVLSFAASLVASRVAFAEVRVQDDYGRTVRLTAPASRIVSLAPHLTELTFSAGAGAKLVGVLAHSDYPAEAAKIRRIGSETGIDLEAVIALRPNLIVAWPNAGSLRAIERLESLGFPTYRSEPRKLEDIARTVERIGELAGTAALARAASRGFTSRIAELRRQRVGQAPVSVFYQIWDRPIMTVTGEHVISRVIDLCGGRNVFAALPGLAPQVDREAVLAAAPQVIVASGIGRERPGWLDDWLRFTSLPAARERQLYFVDPDLIQRHSFRIAEGAARVCELLDRARSRLAPAKTRG